MPPLSVDSGASVSPEGLADTASSADTSPRRRKKKYGFGKRFAYQRLKGWSPILGAGSAELFFLAAGTLLLALGVPILTAALGVKEYSARYDDAGPLAGLSNAQREAALWAAPDAGVEYSVTIRIEEAMEPPIYVVYELGSFRQNYRRYVRSVDTTQMHDGGDGPGAAACEPFVYEGGAPNASAPQGGAVTPCGQIAHSFFNDTYALSLDGAPLELDESDIAWSSDADHLYGDIPAVNYNLLPQFRGGAGVAGPLNQAQHWMVWMRPGGQVPVQKLYARLDAPLPAGANVTLSVANRYNTYAFGGTKRVILTTNSWVGGRNLVLPILYLVVAGLCYALALAFFLSYNAGMVWRRRPGDEAQLSWVRHGGSARVAAA